MRALIYVYIIQEVPHAHAQNTTLERFSSRTGLGVVPRLLSEICWLCNLLINIRGHTETESSIHLLRET